MQYWQYLLLLAPIRKSGVSRLTLLASERQAAQDCSRSAGRWRFVGWVKRYAGIVRPTDAGRGTLVGQRRFTGRPTLHLWRSGRYELHRKCPVRKTGVDAL